MKRILSLSFVLLSAACSKQSSKPAVGNSNPAANAVVEVSGGKQVGRIGTPLDQPIVIQVNDGQGAAVQGAFVTVSTSSGSTVSPGSGVTDSGGQFTSAVSAPEVSGHYQVIATTMGAGGKTIELKLDEIALGYEQLLGQQLNVQYCARCHDPESTAERVSNMDNLDPKPHAFTEGDVLNKISDPDLLLMINRGGAALNQSPSMPPYGYTLSKSEIQALVSYIRAVADPPYKPTGMVYATK